MSILANLLSRWGYYKTQPVKNPAQWMQAAADNASVPDGGLYAAQAELYQRLSWVFSAVNFTASYAAGVPINIKQLRGEKTKDVVNHEFEMLLRKPNPLWSRFEFLRATFAYQLLCGNAYWWINSQGENSKPDEIWIIPPDKIRPVTDGKLYLKGYEYTAGGETIMLPLWQIVHFKSFHPLNDFVGLSSVEPVAIVAAGDLAQQKWVTELYGKNNARLPGIIAFADPITDTDWSMIKRDIKAAASDRSFLLMRNVGKGGVEWMNAVSSIKDMEIMQSRQFSKEEIYSVFAPGLASILAINATEANSRTGKATLIEFSVWPMLTSVSEKVTNDLLPLYSSSQLTYIAEFDDIRTTDRAMELAEMDAYGRSHTIDEIREKYFEDKPLATITKVESDPRGILLPAQISPTTPVPTDEEPETEPEPMMQPEMPTPEEEQPEEDAGEVEEPEQEQRTEEEQAIQADAAKWQRKAIKALKKGQSAQVTFESNCIPAIMADYILEHLQDCKSETDIKDLFRRLITGPTTKREYDEIPALLEAIRLGVEALKVG